MRISIDDLQNGSFVITLVTGASAYGVLMLEAELLIGKEGKTAVMFTVTDGRRLVARTASLVQAIEAYNKHSEAGP